MLGAATFLVLTTVPLGTVGLFMRPEPMPIADGI